MLPAQASVIEGFWYQKNMEVFIHSFLKCNKEERVRILKKLREMSNPVCSSLVYSVGKVIGQILGCKRKLDILTHRNPCAFKLIVSETNNCSLSMKAVLAQRKNETQKLQQKGYPSGRSVFFFFILFSLFHICDMFTICNFIFFIHVGL